MRRDRITTFGRVALAVASAAASLSAPAPQTKPVVLHPKHATRHAPAHARAAHHAHIHHLYGADISWPQCERPRRHRPHTVFGRAKPFPSARFVVLGLTNAHPFTPSPCLRAEVRWVKRHHLHAAAYAVVNYPHARTLRWSGSHGPRKPRTLKARLWNVGYAEARYNIGTLHRVGLRTPVVWVDVEPGRLANWSRHRNRNAAVLRGTIAGYRHAGYRVGVYSTHLLWRSIAGRFRPRLPEWRTAGPRTTRKALRMCRRDAIQGGYAVLAQWWGPRRDFDVLCGKPTSRRRQVWFTKY